MRRITISALISAWGLLAALASTAVAAPEEDPIRQAVIAARFDPFDKAAGDGWEPAFPTPFYRLAGTGQPDAVPLALTPGAYMVVVLCNCETMDVSLVAPGGSTVAPSRTNDQGAMYSLDVAAPGDFLTGVDMNDCEDKACDFAVKVYRKKS